MIFDSLLIAVIALAVSATFNALYHWGLRRKVYTLECDVTDLQTKVLSEIKKRAQSNVRQKPELALLDQMAEKTPPEPPKPWWMKFNDLKVS
jgi:hypothetical protein